MERGRRGVEKEKKCDTDGGGSFWSGPVQHHSQQPDSTVQGQGCVCVEKNFQSTSQASKMTTGPSVILSKARESEVSFPSLVFLSSPAIRSAVMHTQSGDIRTQVTVLQRSQFQKPFPFVQYKFQPSQLLTGCGFCIGMMLLISKLVLWLLTKENDRHTYCTLFLHST